MDISRRQFMRVSAALGSSLVIGVELVGCTENKFSASVTNSFHPNSFLEITPNNNVILQLNRAEMGQGVYTGLATLVAEELDIEPGDISIVFAPSHPEFVDSELRIQLTGGSSSLKNSFEPLRRAGAVARAVLLDAAARDWKVPREQLLVGKGIVRHVGSGREAKYAQFIATANTLTVPDNVPLKSPNQFRLIGKYDKRLDAPKKIDGSAIFGIDVHRDGMVYAVLVRCPHFGGSLKGFDAAVSKQVSGVSDVFAFGTAAVAVVARGYWPARKAANQLVTEWEKGPLAGLDSAAIRNELKRQLDSDTELKATEGVAPGAEGQIIEAEYYAPYQAHAAMEPLNCVADVQADRIDIWCGNQSPDVFRVAVAGALQRAPESVFVHSQFLGGGFGRRAFPDYAVEAALLSKKIGKPVKLMWSREDDMRHDLYRPPALSRFRATLMDEKFVEWNNRLVSPSATRMSLPGLIKAMAPWMPDSALPVMAGVFAPRDITSTDGATKLPYEIPQFNVDYIYFDPGVPVGPWRSVGASLNGFFVESFIDEVAHALKQDPLAFRLSLLKPEASRARAVLKLVAEKSRWGKAPADIFQGIALAECFNTVVAHVVDVSFLNNKLQVHKVTCAVECGLVVNPDIVAMQIESGVIYALSASLAGEITVVDGAIVQSNFHDFIPIRMYDSPAVEVHIVPSNGDPSGVGEPGVPPLAPALGNAIFAATGKRLRELPFRLGNENV
jgi:isoquinoline 1-oxidoreductase subunit beta